MRNDWLTALAFASALGCGLVGGVFFAFSTFVMPALARLPPPQGIAAMQSINVAAINPWFMGGLFGTAGGCAVLAVASLLRWDVPGSAWLLAGGLLYLAGTILVTIACNVPRNDALAAVQGAGATVEVWAAYLEGWTAWNHVRTAAALAAAAAITVALLRHAAVRPA